MNNSVHRFTLDIQKTRSQISIPVLLHDTGVRLYITLTDGGKPYLIENGCLAVFSGKKPDGLPLLNTCAIENNTTVIYEFTEHTASAAGIVDCEVRIYGANGKLKASPAFILVVDERVTNDDDVNESLPDTSALDDIFINEAARAASENAREKAEAERCASEMNRVASETERSSSESLRDASEKERVSSEESRAAAEKERVIAEALRAAAFNLIDDIRFVVDSEGMRMRFYLKRANGSIAEKDIDVSKLATGFNGWRFDEETHELITVYCANQAGDGVVFANKLTARKWNWQGGGWLDATITYDDIVDLKGAIFRIKRQNILLDTKALVEAKTPFVSVMRGEPRIIEADKSTGLLRFYTDTRGRGDSLDEGLVFSDDNLNNPLRDIVVTGVVYKTDSPEGSENARYTSDIYYATAVYELNQGSWNVDGTTNVIMYTVEEV